MFDFKVSLQSQKALVFLDCGETDYLMANGEDKNCSCSPQEAQEAESERKGQG